MSRLPAGPAYRIALAAAVATTVVTRLWDLGARPVMHDESLFAYYTWANLFQGFDYIYQPILHGPAMLWIQNVVFHVFGVGDATMRLGVALLGIGGLAWVWAMRPWLGRVGVLVALWFYALSPMLMYYQRFFRNDGLFLFTSLWIAASALYWGRSKSPRWAASLLAGCWVLLCNKESSVFVYFTLVTFGMLLVAHDLSAGIADRLGRGTTTRWREMAGAIAGAAGRVRWRPAVAWALAAFVFGVLVLTRVFEGMRWDDDVVRATGRDFLLRDVRSIPLALGWEGAVPGLGRLGQPLTWRLFYLLGPLAPCVVALAVAAGINGQWGRNHALAVFADAFHRARWAIGATMTAGLFAYLALFSTGFQHPLGPFQIARETLAYWMGQHAMHRIEGPFHMHGVNLLVYELPLALLFAGGGVAVLLGRRWRGLDAGGAALAGIALLVFQAVVSRGGTGTSYFAACAIILFAFAAVTAARPGWSRHAAGAALAAWVLYSVALFNSAGWRSALALPVTGDGAGSRLALAFLESRGRELTGRDFLYEKLSMSSGAHLALVVLLVACAAAWTWRDIERGRRGRAFFVWWTVTAFGAASYAREKVPWVGIHAAPPLVLLAGVLCEDAWQRLRTRRRRIMAASALALALAWQAKTALVLCFVNGADVREKLVYGHTTTDLHAHVGVVVRYRDAAGVQTTRITADDGARLPRWLADYNDPASTKDLRVLVGATEIAWPLRWYLRDIEWSEATPLETALDEQWPFLFLDVDQVDEDPRVREEYTVRIARGRMHWTPGVIDPSALLDGWRVFVPQNRRTLGESAYRAQEARAAWGSVARYMLHRELPGDDGSGVPSLSYIEYAFCARKDLGPF